MAWRLAKESKYHNKKVTQGGETFDSMRELRRWNELKLLERAGRIHDLQRQVKFLLIPAQRGPETTSKTGRRKRGEVLERECSYVADFVYMDDATGEKVVEDAKGMRTEVYKIKKKLMLERYGIRVQEV